MTLKAINLFELRLEGVPTDQISSENAKRSYPLDENLIEIATFGTREPRYLGVGTELQQGYYMTPSEEFGWIGFNYLTDMLMNRIWVTPLRIAGGFITEEQIYEITIWNAYLERSVDWTAIAVIREPGTQFDFPAFPFSFAPTASINRDLTIDRFGPPLQDTYWQLTIDGLVFEIYVDGIRVVPLEEEPNWESEIKMAYNFQTVMYNTERLHEQRRALQEISSRKTNFTFVLEQLRNHRFFNRIAYGHDKIFGVPIFSEKLFPTAVTQGTTLITHSNSNEFMWNFQNRMQFVMIANHEDRILEIKEVLSFTDYQITLKATITESFDINKTVVYPCLFCVVGGAKYNEKSSHVQTADLEFKEFISSG
jgi:hypothetical protein